MSGNIAFAPPFWVMWINGLNSKKKLSDVKVCITSHFITLKSNAEQIPRQMAIYSDKVNTNICWGLHSELEAMIRGTFS